MASPGMVEYSFVVLLFIAVSVGCLYLWGIRGILVVVGIEIMVVAAALPGLYHSPTGKKTPAQQTAALHEEMAKLQEKIDATTAKLTAIEKHMHTCGVKDWLVYDGRAK